MEAGKPDVQQDVADAGTEDPEHQDRYASRRIRKQNSVAAESVAHQQIDDLKTGPAHDRHHSGEFQRAVGFAQSGTQVAVNPADRSRPKQQRIAVPLSPERKRRRKHRADDDACKGRRDRCDHQRCDLPFEQENSQDHGETGNRRDDDGRFRSRGVLDARRLEQRVNERLTKRCQHQHLRLRLLQIDPDLPCRDQHQEDGCRNRPAHRDHLDRRDDLNDDGRCEERPSPKRRTDDQCGKSDALAVLIPLRLSNVLFHRYP